MAKVHINSYTIKFYGTLFLDLLESFSPHDQASNENAPSFIRPLFTTAAFRAAPSRGGPMKGNSFLY